MYYNRAETMEMLKITPPTLYLWIKEGRLIKHKRDDGRVYFKKDEVNSLMEKRKSIVVAEV